MKKIFAYIANVKSEMQKVTWPTKDELVQATTLVVSFALVLSLIVGAMDLVIFSIFDKIL